MKTVTKKDLCFKLNEDISLADGDSRKFRGVAYSGQMIKGHPFWGDLIFDISTMTYDKKIPVLFNHDPNRIVGSGTLEKADQLILNGEFSKTTSDGITLFELVKNEGFPMQESVFIEPDVEELKKGKAVVNGVEIEAPATIFRNGRIREVSLTPLGADGNTSTQAFNLTTVTVKTLKEKKPMSKVNKNFEKFSELLEESPEEAFKFACGCQSKEGTAASETDSSALDALKSENADLKAQLEAALSELKTLKDAKMSEERTGKIRQIKELFSKFGTEATEDLIDTYLATPESKFATVLASVEANMVKIQGEKKFANLTKETKLEVPAANKEQNEQLEKIRIKAAELRNKFALENSGQTLQVPDSYAQARFELGIKE